MQAVPWFEAFRTWCRVAVLSFGGPAGQIAVMHRILVDEKKWIREERFLHALNYCMLLPGPEATQLATYIGWLMHGTRGGVMAGTLFILPGIVCILALSILYAQYQQTDMLQALFFGLKPAVMAIVLEAVLRIGKRVLKNGTMAALAAAAFVAIFFFQVPFPLVVLTAGLTGFLGGKFAPRRFQVLRGHGPAGGGQAADAQQKAAHAESERTEIEQKERFLPHDNPPPTLARGLKVCAVCLPLWFAPPLLFYWWLGPESVFFQQGVFFSQTAVVSFGGAYAVLAYVAQQAVEKHGWLAPGEMYDGLGMAETTPGPLIMVLQFVGFVGAFRHPGPFSPLWAGVVGSLLTTWVTFVPCFLWIFLGAPYIERLRGNKLLSSALSAITAAVVGVVLNLAVWFALQPGMLFATVKEHHIAGARLLVPDLASANPATCGIAVIGLLLTFVFKRGLGVTLGVCTLLGLALYWWK
ncbi:MAG: chromate efflux transporter [Pirellulales bacterium]